MKYKIYNTETKTKLIVDEELLRKLNLEGMKHLSIERIK